MPRVPSRPAERCIGEDRRTLATHRALVPLAQKDRPEARDTFCRRSSGVARWAGGRGSRSGWPLLFFAALLAACGGRREPAPVGTVGSSGGAVVSGRVAGTPVHRVRRGDTLYAIAWRYGLDYRRLATWNGISPPYLIRPGQRLALRPSGTGQRRSVRRPALGGRKPSRSRTASRPAEPDRSTREAASGHGPKRKRPTVSVARTPALTRHPSGRTGRITRNGRWAWPVKGAVIRRYRQEGNRGLDIAGKLGTPVKASARGKVVYSGSGLIGYGKLIIIKHDERFLTAYAHNNKILVSEGQFVSKGSRIAEMGSTGTTRVKLHFEIRKDGHPVNPARYLPSP